MAILRHLQQKGSSSRYEIARECSLSYSAASALVAELIDIGIVTSLGPGKSAGGRRPELLSIDETAGYIIAVDIGSANVTCARVDLSAQIHDKLVIDTPSDPAASVDATVELIETVVANARNHAAKPLFGVGVATPGYVSTQRGTVIRASNLGWIEVPLAEKISRATGLPAIVDNNANAAALGEMYYGKGAGISNFLYLALGRGIGAGLVTDGELYRGTTNAAGEFGHVTVTSDGPVCTCGRIGCLESVASGRAIEMAAQAELGGADVDFDGADEKSLVARVFAMAEAGDPVASNIVDRVMTNLAIAIANSVAILNPQRVIVGGGLTRGGSSFLEKLTSYVWPRLLAERAKDVELILSSSNEDSGLRGAATLVVEQLFEQVHTLKPNAKDAANAVIANLRKVRMG